MSILASPCTFVIILRLYPFLSLPRPPEAVFIIAYVLTYCLLFSRVVGILLYTISVLACLPLSVNLAIWCIHPCRAVPYFTRPSLTACFPMSAPSTFPALLPSSHIPHWCCPPY
ncbi:hypothetical protein JB92DRAFT_2896521, partial [Gautieria morchelliformis]